jgi:hypothetical protein
VFGGTSLRIVLKGGWVPNLGKEKKQKSQKGEKQAWAGRAPAPQRVPLPESCMYYI